MELLIMIDMQNDFISGPLGNSETLNVVNNVCKEIQKYKENNIPLIYTMDTHNVDYLETQEGKNLPVPHCMANTLGWSLDPKVQDTINGMTTIMIPKNTFGAKTLPEQVVNLMNIYPITSIKLIGVCTDICVISNAMLLKAYFPEIKIIVKASCCAGVSPESHQRALDSMKTCQVIIED